MMKVLLVQPPHYYDGKTRPPEYFPLGLGYIATPLLKSRYDVEVLDIWAHQWTNDEVLQRIQELDYDIVGISALSTQYAYVKWLTNHLKKHKASKIVVGGALATFSPEIVLRYTDADICVIGEGEVTFKEVVENIDHLHKVKGICFKQGGEIIWNPLREYIKDLDSIDFPTWELFSMDIYLNNCRVFAHPNIEAMNIVTNRGCPYNCRFCSKTFARLRTRSVDNIIKEIEELKRRFGIRGISFNDELVVLNKRRVYELCEKIEPLNLKWNCQGRVDLVDFELLKRMKKAGCVAIGYGIESGSPTILDSMNKKATVEQAEAALRNTVKAGLFPIVQMMYGYPGETRGTLQETIHFFRRAPYLGVKGIFTVTNFTPTTALPGAELYDQSLERGLIDDEEKYLDALSIGYNPTENQLLINFTGFDEAEFYRLKRETERRVLMNHIKKYPFRFTLDYLREMLLPYFRVHGVRATVRKILRTLVNLWQLLMRKGLT